MCTYIHLSIEKNILSNVPKLFQNRDPLRVPSVFSIVMVVMVMGGHSAKFINVEKLRNFSEISGISGNFLYLHRNEQQDIVRYLLLSATCYFHKFDEKYYLGEIPGVIWK